MTAAPHTTARRLITLAARLADRDRQVLDSLARVRLATTRQLERLHFIEAEPSANARSARRTLAKLERAGVVNRLERRVGGVRAGSAGMMWALGAVGQRLVASTGPAGGRQPRRPWTPSAAFVSHRLGITELYVELVEAARRGDTELVRFEAEPDCWRPYIGAHGGRVMLKPDAFIVTAQGEWEDRWFVEVDCGTESPAVITRKARAYLAYWRSGREQAKSGVFPLVLFVVPGEPRRDVLAATLKKLSEDDRRLFRAALQDEALGVLTGGAT